MIGYEARARVTADVAGFVAGQRQAAQAAGTLATAVQTLNTRLIETQRLAAQNAAALNRIGQTATTTGRQQQAAANSADMLGDAMRQGAAAYSAAQAGAQAASQAMQANAQAAQRNTQAANTNAQAQRTSSQSLQSMGRELARLRNEQERYQALVRTGAQLTRDQQESYNRINQRVGQLTQQYMRLSGEQRRQVTAARELAQASRLATQGIQEQSAAQVRLNQTGNLTMTQLQAMAREVVTLERNRDRLTAAQREGVVLNRQEAQSLEATQGRLRELARLYGQLDVAQKQVFTSTRQIANANQAATAASRQATDALRQQERAARDLNNSHWGMRSALGDVAGSMSQLWSVSTRVTSALWENYRAQEMAVAQIARVSNETALELDKITTSLRDMSTQIPIAFDELAEIAMLGSQVGVATHALDTFTETVALFAATSEVSAEQTSQLMARIMEMTKLNETHGVTSVRNLGSAIAYMGSNFLATDAEILKATESISTMTTQAGFSAEATVGLATAMSSVALRPEIMRGASQRVFLQLGQAVEGTSSSMERLVDVTGMSQDQLIALRDDSFEDYFLTIMQGLAGLADEGQNLVPILRELGIINTRDADVVARLAGNYDILTRAVEGSYEAFANGTYLQQESDRIFATLDARVQILSNTWSNFMFTAVEAIAPFIIRVVDAATAMIDFAETMNAAPLVGGAAVLLAIAGGAAVVASGLGFMAQGIYSLIGAWRLWQGTATATASTMAAGTAATVANTAATTANTGAKTAAILANTRIVGSTTAATAAVAAQTAATTAASAAMRGLGLALRALSALSGIVAVIGAAKLAWDAFSASGERANQTLLRSQEANINAAGGLDALHQAIQTDTEVWREAREQVYEHVNALGDSTSAYSSSAEEVIRSSRFRVQAIGEMSAEDAKAAREAEILADHQQQLSDELGTTSETARETSPALAGVAESAAEVAQSGIAADNSIGQINGALKDTSQAAEESTVAIGLATRQWAALSLEAAILETDLLGNEEAFKLVKDAGVDFSRALTMEMDEAGSGVRQLQSDFYYFYDSLSTGERFTANFSQAIHDLSGGFIDVRTDAAIAGQAMWDASENLAATTLSIEEATRAGQELDGMFVMLPNGVRASQEELAMFADEGEEAAAMALVMEQEVGNLGIALETLHESFVSFFDPLNIWNETLSKANEGLEDQYASLLDMPNGFALYLDELERANQAQINWADNLLRLGQRGDIPADVIAGLAEMGAEGAEIVEGLANANDAEVARFVDAWDGGMGATSESFTVMFSDFLAQAISSGDQGGVDFVRELMNRVNEGDITFREAVDEMTAYAEEEFQNADTTNEPMLDNTKALKELTNLIRKVEQDTTDTDADIHPSVDSRGFWKSIGDWFRSLWDWWQTNVVDAFRVRLDIIANQGRGGGGRGYADGGWIEGQGGPRQDNIPIMASNKEFMVNAASAARWGPLLEWINNDGNLPARTDYVPQMPVGDNVRTSMPAAVRSRPDFAQIASAGVRSQGSGEQIVFNINNHYPQAEPTSVTTNRALQYVAGLNGVL